MVIKQQILCRQVQQHAPLRLNPQWQQKAQHLVQLPLLKPVSNFEDKMVPTKLVVFFVHDVIGSLLSDVGYRKAVLISA